MDETGKSLKASSTHGENRYPGLLQTWIRDNAELKPYINMKSWYLLVQFLLRSLKSDNSAEIDTFISDLFPNLFRDEVPYFLAAQGLTSLRSAMLSYIMEEQKRRGARETDEQILKVISIFDRVFRYLNTQIRQYSEPKNGTVIEILDGELPENRPNLMVLRVDGRRFEGTVRMDRQLKQFLGLTERRLLTSVNWDMFIHPDDMPDVLTSWRNSVENRSPVYELGYRLKHNDGDWRNVLEIGRILYSTDGKPIAGVTVLMESDTAELLGQLPPDYLLRYLIDSRKDMTLLVDQNAQTLYATPLLVQQIAQPEKPANGTLPKSTAVLQNESDRKITAVNFWEILAQSQSAGKHQKTIQIKIQNDPREQDKTLDFRLIKLAKIFGKPVYLLWATEISAQKNDSELAGKLADLHRFSADLKSQIDTSRIYQSVVAAIRQTIPAADAAAMLLLTDNGFLFGLGYGYPESENSEHVFIDRQTFRDWDKNAEIDVRTEVSKLLSAELLKNENLQKEQQLVEIIRIHGQAKVVLQAGITHRSKKFDENDRHIFVLLSQFCQSALERLTAVQGAREKDANYRMIFDRSQLPMWIVREGKGLSFNRQFTNLMEITPERAVDLPISAWIHPDDLVLFRKTLNYVEENSSIYQENFRLSRADGLVIPCSVNFLPIDFRGKPAVLLEALELNPVEKLEPQLQSAQKRETVSQLATGLAHDFNNIIGAILPSAQMILQQPENIEQNQNRARVIYQMAQRAAAITGKLLNYSKSEPAVEKSRFSLLELVEDTRDLVEKMVGSAIDVQYDLPESAPEINGDYGQVTQVLLNLASNAKDAMPDGGKIIIRVREKIIDAKSGNFKALKPGNYVCLSVQDNGGGIPQEIRKQIFKPFYSTKGNGQGSGLGLSIVQGIIKKHNGYLMLQSVENQGSIFHLYLPSAKVADQKQSPTVTPKADAKRAETKPETNQPKAAIVRSPARKDSDNGHNIANGKSAPNTQAILVIDDEPHLLEVYEAMLQMMNFNVLIAKNGREGLRKYYENASDIALVILDFGMPGLNGEQVFRALRKMNPAVQVLLSTGLGEQRAVAGLVQNDAVPLLQKPFTVESLSRKVSELVGTAVLK